MMAALGKTALDQNDAMTSVSPHWGLVAPFSYTKSASDIFDMFDADGGNNDDDDDKKNVIFEKKNEKIKVPKIEMIMTIWLRYD